MKYRPCRHVPLVPQYCKDCYLAVNNESFSAWKEDLPEGIEPNIASNDLAEYIPPSLKDFKKSGTCKYLGEVRGKGSSCGATLRLCLYDDTLCNTTKPCSSSTRCCLYCSKYEEKK